MIAPPLSCNAMDLATLMEKVNMVFARLDTNKDGVLTKDEFIEGCLKDQEILQSLENFQLNILWEIFTKFKKYCRFKKYYTKFFVFDDWRLFVIIFP